MDTHEPVMCRQVVELLAPAPGKILLDCTVGGGGHAAVLGPALSPGGRYIGLDQDPDARHRVRERCAEFPVPLDLIRSNFDSAESVLADLGVKMGIFTREEAAAAKGISSRRGLGKTKTKLGQPTLAPGQGSIRRD